MGRKINSKLLWGLRNGKPFFKLNESIWQSLSFQMCLLVLLRVFLLVTDKHDAFTSRMMKNEETFGYERVLRSIKWQQATLKYAYIQNLKLMRWHSGFFFSSFFCRCSRLSVLILSQHTLLCYTAHQTKEEEKHKNCAQSFLSTSHTIQFHFFEMRTMEWCDNESAHILPKRKRKKKNTQEKNVFLHFSQPSKKKNYAKHVVNSKFIEFTSTPEVPASDKYQHFRRKKETKRRQPNMDSS